MKDQKTVLVLGGEGQLAQCLRLQLTIHRVQKRPEKQPVYHFISRSEMPFEFLKQKHLEQLYRRFNPEVIVNAAAYTSVDLAEDEAERCFQVNVEATKIITQFCADQKIKYIHFSSDYIFDGRQSTPYAEEDLDGQRPLSVYGKSKKASEQVVMDSGCVFTIIRTSWLYSPFRRNFFKTMEQILKTKDAFVVIDQIGTPTYAIDLVEVVMRIVEKMIQEKNFSSNIFHYSNEGTASWYDFACAIKRYTNSDQSCGGKILPVSSQEYPQRAKRPTYSVMNKDKIKKYLNLHIDHWEESLMRCTKLNSSIHG